jgi:tape measure domain-containing protein
MPTERIDIIVTERGTRQVKRNIEDLATASDRAESELDQLRASLRAITPTTQLRQALEQIQSLRTALAAPRSRAAWLNTPLNEANAALVQIGTNLRNARREMGTDVEWDAVAEFRQAEQELNDVIARLRTVRSMQTEFINRNNVRDRSTGLPPTIPNIVTLPEVNRFAADAERAARGAHNLADGVNTAGTAARGARRPFLLLNRYVGAFGGAFVAMELMRLSDSATVVSNRINIVSEDLDQATTVMGELYDIARRTRTPIEELSAVFQKGMMAAGELGVNQEEVLRFVEAVGMGLAVQGSTAQTARGALIQLSQAIGTDIVRAEEFNSILEGAYPLALAAARGIERTGGSVARLRQEVIEGNVSSQEFFEAIMSQYPMIADMFAQTEPTISQALTVFRNKLTEYISTSEEAQAISSTLADAIILIADNIEPLADFLFSLGIAWGVAFTAGKIALVGQMATNVGLLGTAAAGLRATMGFMGGPIVGGLALLAGAAFWVYQNTESAADKIERLNEVMNDGASALQTYNEHVQIARQEQEELGGVINLTTEAMLRQSRAELQATLATLQSEIRDLEADLEGSGLFNANNLSRTMSELWERGGAQVRPDPDTGIFGVQFDNAEIGRIWELLRAVRDGTGSIDDFYAAIERVRGAGPEITAAAEDLAIAMDALPDDLTQQPTAQAELWLQQAEEQLANIAEAIGGLDAEIQAAAEAQSLPEKVQALEALRDGLEAARLAGNIVRGSSWISDTADLLNALQDARDLESSMLEALGANAERLQELADEAERFREPMQGAEAAAGDTQATLDRINFTPLEQGAREFADQLVRAAAAASIIGNTELQGGGSGIVLASAGVTRDQIGTNGLATLNSGGSFTVGGNGGIDQNLISFWASKGEQVTVTPRGQSLMDATDRTGQSQEYLNTIQLINQELETRYSNIMRNNQGMEEQRLLQEALRIAQQESTILNKEDIALIEERVNALAALERRMELINDVSDAVFDNLEQALNNFVETGTFNFNEFASSVIKDLARIGIQMMIIAPLKNFFGGILGNLLPAALPGFNEGADFMVGGTGGVDKNVVAFRASRGERVQVTPAGKESGNGGNTVIFQISTPDVEGFRRSESQMAARAQRMLARGQRNS